MSILKVNNLGVQFQTNDGVVNAVNGVSFELNKGQTLGIVGESGSGKSQTMLAMMGLLAKNGQASGQALFHGQDLLTLPTRDLNRIRGDRVSMIFQDPMTSLNPYLTVERQMTEVLELHKGMSRRDAKKRAIELLDAVRIPEAARRVDMYPHEFSGGMRQRVMIAMALLCEPELLIADEPTTALDVTVQAQILSLLKDLQRDFGTAIIMITHDLGVVAGLCENVLVMYGGRAMEYGRADDIFYHPSHPYTIGLLGALPRLDHEDAALISIPGNPPNMANMPKGCPFSERCAHAVARCASELPPLAANPLNPQILRACHKPAEELVKAAEEVTHA
ncbi:oligopeptide ABC transporter ATP-binding protein OppD [Chromobacterium vaccinii]|uniref:ABC transporter ATP-binding protein n=3 Tax=Chromobacteriaceae TaxID=1499392 RepID=A0A1D9LJC7_9NEIS|nr:MULTISPECIES: oligopeptide/dipeptide ABC transporter ATP-binding protein [Chromobacteriaceae]AOZ51313.1 ABC transporter ATP-binding protein [Chromobacterium vaccinii]AVG15582.1 ABC transporter ATP-binding protein [Chromobacterium vaccinii]ERE06185.1 peptide ABC transporter ATP-binding protein [Pseudogulbenkiania ferrooxidans EGD-HP2]MCD4486597.1 oligopeptide ABC transporter ATP-binding protein OppD [Chromobacterium vaccinii]MCD4501899.1 oligopeptide ABC transporter ATP-binding protein OppD 